MLTSGVFPAAGDAYQYNAQKPKVSVRWQPVDPKYIGAVTAWQLHRSVPCADVAELNPAGSQSFPLVVDPYSRIH